MAAPANPSPLLRLARLLVGFLGIAALLSTLLIAAATALEAWQEHSQSQWPQSVATVHQCDVDRSPYSETPSYRIDCNLRYVAGGDHAVEAHLYSRSTTDPGQVLWQYPPNKLERMQAWANAHGEGSQLLIRYDPAHSRNAVLVGTDMPLGGVRTPGNLRLLAFSAVLSGLLLGIARALRPTDGAAASAGPLPSSSASA